MKINEVEALVGITKKNIRFYESEELLSPERNSENGYRDYSEKDVDTLKRIKLLRKLGFPLQEIRLIQNGNHTLTDGIKRHLILMEREEKSLVKTIELCKNLSLNDTSLESLNADEILENMENMEEKGVKFMDKYNNDKNKSMIAPVIVAGVVSVIMLSLAYFIIYNLVGEEIPWVFLTVFTVSPLFVVLGTAIVMFQRLKEIKKGELYEAKKY